MARLSERRLPWVAVAATAASFVCIGAALALRDPSSVDLIEASENTASASASSSAPAPSPSLAEVRPPPELSSTVPQAPVHKRAGRELDLATTLAELKALAQQFPEDERVLVKLARVQAAQPAMLLDALKNVRTALDLDENVKNQKDVHPIVLRGASGVPDVQDLAFAIMQRSMGTVGPDLLYELTIAQGVSPNVATRAREATKLDEVRKLASAALLVAIDLRDHPGCGRKPYLSAAEKDGDLRSLQYLSPLMSKKSCGVFGMKDCNNCFGNREEVRRAVEAIKARAGVQ
ncbi:MAG: hypothetical protein U0271_07730 [Polyangiaceae bacterium]